MVCKGMKEKMNYLVLSDCMYDLQFMLPMTFLKTGEDELPDLFQVSLNERKLSKDKSNYLGLGNLSNIFTGHSLKDLFYMWQLSSMTPDDMASGDIFLEHFNPRYNDKTIFHKYATDLKFLKLIFDEIKKSD